MLYVATTSSILVTKLHQSTYGCVYLNYNDLHYKIPQPQSHDFSINQAFVLLILFVQKIMMKFTF